MTSAPVCEEPLTARATAPAAYDRRTEIRERRRLRASLFALDGADPIRCSTDNVGPGGMHVTVPVGYGLAVGQRYEIKLDEGRGDDLIGEGNYATVVRTQIATDEPTGKVGVGMRFDMPIIL